MTELLACASGASCPSNKAACVLTPIMLCRFSLAKAQARLHTVEGLMKAQADMNTVVDVIRSAPDGPAASQQLQSTLDLSPDQVSVPCTEAAIMAWPGLISRPSRPFDPPTSLLCVLVLLWHRSGGWLSVCVHVRGDSFRCLRLCSCRSCHGRGHERQNWVWAA